MQTKYLIIGQGIAGTMVSYFLSRKNISHIVIDNDAPQTPSKISSGVINPVTGRRLVEVWLADEVIPFAVETYQKISTEHGVDEIKTTAVIDFFPNPFMRESFLKRLSESNKYVEMVVDESPFAHFNYEFGLGKISPVYIAPIIDLLEKWKNILKEKNQYRNEKFDASQLQLKPDKILYNDIEAEKIIFCGGTQDALLPFFSRLPFAENKGEALLVEIEGLATDAIYKKGTTIVPTSDIFWVGSNYQWTFANSHPTEQFKQECIAFLQSFLKVPFKVVDHVAAIRPATVERRPFVGIHPLYNQVVMLNGLGTKGCSLAPYFAHQLVEHLINDTPILPEAAITRFAKTLSR